MSVQLPPLDFAIPELIVIQKLAQSLNFCRLKQAYNFEIVTHEMVAIARQFGYH